MRRVMKSRSKRLILWVAMGGALAVVGGSMIGCPEATPPAPQQGVTDVAIRNIAFDPMVVTIKVGESVRWTNFDAIIPHTTTSGNPGDTPEGAIWNSFNLATGQSFTRQFSQAGDFVYFCQVHPVMMRDAMVKVVP